MLISIGLLISFECIWNHYLDFVQAYNQYCVKLLLNVMHYYFILLTKKLMHYLVTFYGK